MRYFKYLDLDWKNSSESLRNYLANNPTLIDVALGAWCRAPNSIFKQLPELVEMFKPLNITPILAGFFVTRTETGTIHIDDSFVPIRINIPVLNCEHTKTKYFKVSGFSETRFQSNKKRYFEYSSENAEEVDSFELTQPVAMRVLEPHQVVSYTKNLPRISFTVAFKEDLSFLLD